MSVKTPFPHSRIEFQKPLNYWQCCFLWILLMTSPTVPSFDTPWNYLESFVLSTKSNHIFAAIWVCSRVLARTGNDTREVTRMSWREVFRREILGSCREFWCTVESVKGSAEKHCLINAVNAGQCICFPLTTGLPRSDWKKMSSFNNCRRGCKTTRRSSGRQTYV